MSGKVYIVGVAARSFEWEADAQVWVINHAALMYPERWNTWFHLHGPEHVWAQVSGSRQLNYLAKECSDRRRPVFVPDAEIWRARLYNAELAENVVAFPYLEIIEEFGRFQTSSFPLVIDHAIREGFSTIVLDGVQYAADAPAEAWAVRCIDYHLGLAVGRGINVLVPPGAGLLDCTHVYGFEGPGSV